MKTSYLFGAILACNLVGVMMGGRAAKTSCLLLSGALAIYGLVRLLG
jgi:hypothetical protein